MAKEQEQKNWLRFIEASPKLKTKVWHVSNPSKFTFLGEIKWHGPFRKYAFFPDNDLLFDAQCLTEIAEFLIEHKNDKI